MLSVVPKKTVTEEQQESVMRAIHGIMADAERGDVETVIVIARHADGNWTDRASTTHHYSDCIGRLEILKQTWINQYLADDH